MAPPIESFSASELPDRVQITAEGRRRKRRVDLRKCELMELVQYDCHVEGRNPSSRSLIRCLPIVRLFRRYGSCGDQCTIETTAIEGTDIM